MSRGSSELPTPNTMVDSKQNSPDLSSETVTVGVACPRSVRNTGAGSVGCRSSSATQARSVWFKCRGIGVLGWGLSMDSPVQAGSSTSETCGPYHLAGESTTSEALMACEVTLNPRLSVAVARITSVPSGASTGITSALSHVSGLIWPNGKAFQWLLFDALFSSAMCHSSRTDVTLPSSDAVAEQMVYVPRVTLLARQEVLLMEGGSLTWVWKESRLLWNRRSGVELVYLSLRSNRPEEGATMVRLITVRLPHSSPAGRASDVLFKSSLPTKVSRRKVPLEDDMPRFSSRTCTTASSPL